MRPTHQQQQQQSLTCVWSIHGSGQVGSQNSPPWVHRVGSGPVSKISSIEFTRNKLIIRRV